MLGKNLEMNSKDLSDSLSLLSSSISQIFSKQCSKLSYEELYRNVYYLVLNRFGERAYNDIKIFMEMNIKGKFEEFHKNCEKDLSEIIAIFREINEMIKIVNSICLYLHKKYILVKKVPNLLIIGKGLFIKHFMNPEGKLYNKMIRDVMDSFLKDRKNEIVDKVTLTGITTMMVFLRKYSIIYK